MKKRKKEKPATGKAVAKGAKSKKTSSSKSSKSSTKSAIKPTVKPKSSNSSKAEQRSGNQKKGGKKNKSVKQEKSNNKDAKKGVSELKSGSDTGSNGEKGGVVGSVQLPESEPKPKITQKEIRELRAKNWIRSLITFELVGKPREHIEQTMHSYIENIKNDDRIRAINEEFADAIELEDGLFSTFVEFEALVEDMETFTWICINFMPASIEILEPEVLTLSNRVMQEWFNDLLAKLHETSNILREERAITKGLTESVNVLIKNSIISTLASGKKNAKEIQSMVGVQESQLLPFIKNLVKNNKIVDEGDGYSLR